MSIVCNQVRIPLVAGTVMRRTGVTAVELLAKRERRRQREGATWINRPIMMLASVPEGRIKNKNTVGSGRRDARKCCGRIMGVVKVLGKRKWVAGKPVGVQERLPQNQDDD